MSETKKPNRFDRWMQKKLLPVMGKIGQQAHLSAIRDGFALVLPLIIASAVGLVIQTTIFGASGANKSSILGLFNRWIYGPDAIYNSNGEWQFLGPLASLSKIFGNVFASMQVAGLGTIAITFAFTYGYSLAAARKDENPIMGGLVSLATFFLVTAGAAGTVKSATDGSGNYEFLGQTSFYDANGFLSVILYSSLSVELYVKLSKSSKLRLVMPDGVPEAISRAFAKLFPVVLTLLAAAGFYALIAVPTYYTDAPLLVVRDMNGSLVTSWEIPTEALGGSGFWTPADLIYAIFQSPLVSFATNENANLGVAILYTFLIGFFWWFGLHGTNVANGVFLALWTILYNNNATDPSGATGSIFVFGTFDAFIFLGGPPAVMGLILSGLTFSKLQRDKLLFRLAITPDMFNICEPVIFGLPLVTNFSYLIPSMFIMPLLCVTTWIFYKSFGTSYVRVAFPWAIPIGIGSLFATNFDYTAFLIFLINFIVSIAAWIPFVFLSNHLNADEIRKQKIEAKKQMDEGVALPAQVAIKATKFKFKWSSFGLLVIPTFILGGFIISVAATFGDSGAGIAMAVIEGVFIFLLGVGLFTKNLWLPIFKKMKKTKVKSS